MLRVSTQLPLNTFLPQLVAEDNLINQQIAMKTLKMMGFSCKAASNGKEAITLMNSKPFDLVLMDCQMPEMDGYEATMRLRASQSLEIRSVPIIALTASAIRGDKERCLEAGMSDYLSKPVKRPALESMLVRWLFDNSTRQTLSRWAATPTPTPGMTSQSTMSTPTVPSVSTVASSALMSAPTPSSRDKPLGIDTFAFNTTAQPARDAMNEELGPLDQPSKTKSVSAPAQESDTTTTLDSSTSETARLWRDVSLSQAMEIRKAEMIDNPGISALRRASAHDGHLFNSTAASQGKAMQAMAAAAARPNLIRSRSGPTSPLSVGTPASTSSDDPSGVRRTSREQAGLGRDLAGEMERASSIEAEPSLGAAMESPPETTAGMAKIPLSVDGDHLMAPPA